MTPDDLKKIFACFEVTFPCLLRDITALLVPAVPRAVVTNTDCAGNTQCPVVGSEPLFPQ